MNSKQLYEHAVCISEMENSELSKRHGNVITIIIYYYVNPAFDAKYTTKDSS